MAGFSNYLRNKLIDFFHRGQAFTPPTSIFLALCSTQPNAASAGTELTGTGYARQEVLSAMTDWSGTQGSGTTTVSTGTSGITSNNNDIDFGTAGSAWGTAAYWEMYDAVTGGNRLLFGTIVDGAGTFTPRPIANGDPVSFPAAALQIPWA